MGEGAERRVVGVLDIDSDHLNAFDDDRKGLEDIVEALTTSPTLHFG